MSSSRHTLRPAHAPQVAYRDPVFLESKVARPLRILGEYLHPLVQLRQEGIGDTIVMFGSARIGSREAAAARLARLKQTRTARFSGGRQKQHRAALREARSALEMSRYYEEARELSRRITAWAMTLGEHPRRFGSRRQVRRPFHRASPRTVCQSLHQPRAELQLPLLFHAQALVRAALQSPHRFSGRLWHHGRTLGNAHPAANRQAPQTQPDSHLRPPLLG